MSGNKQRGMKASGGFTLIELLIVVAIIAILASIAVPNFLEAQVRANVSRCMSDMRTEALALEAYTVDYNVAPLHTPSSTDSGAPSGINYFDHIPYNGNALLYWGGVRSASGLNPGDAILDAGKNRLINWWEAALTTPQSYLSRRVDDVFHRKQEWMTADGSLDTYFYDWAQKKAASNQGFSEYGNFYYMNYEHYTKAYLRINANIAGSSWGNSNSADCSRIYAIGGYRWVLVSSGPSFRGKRGQIEAANAWNMPYIGQPKFPSYDPTNGSKSCGYVLRTNKGVYRIDTVPDYSQGGYGGNNAKNAAWGIP